MKKILEKLKEIKKSISYYENGNKKKEKIKEIEKENLFEISDELNKNNIKNKNQSYNISNEDELKEEDITEEEISNSKKIKSNKSLDEQIKDLFKNEIFLRVLPLILASLSIIYKYLIKYRYGVPIKYFKIDFTEILFYTIILLIPLIFYFFIKNKVIQGILLIFLIIFEIYLLSKNQIFLFGSICLFFGISFFLFVSLESKINCLKKNWYMRIIFIILLSQPFVWIIGFFSDIFKYEVFLEDKYLYFIVIIFMGFFFFGFYDRENKKSNLENKIQILNIIYIVCFIFCILIMMLKFLSPKTEYEIFYKDNKPKVVITTYEDKYLIMDCDYDKEQNQLTTIYTKNYEFIDINQAKEINYINLSKEPIIEKNKPKNNI